MGKQNLMNFNKIEQAQTVGHIKLKEDRVQGEAFLGEELVN